MNHAHPRDRRPFQSPVRCRDEAAEGLEGKEGTDQSQQGAGGIAEGPAALAVNAFAFHAHKLCIFNDDTRLFQ